GRCHSPAPALGALLSGSGRGGGGERLAQAQRPLPRRPDDRLRIRPGVWRSPPLEDHRLRRGPRAGEVLARYSAAGVGPRPELSGRLHHIRVRIRRSRVEGPVGSEPPVLVRYLDIRLIAAGQDPASPAAREGEGPRDREGACSGPQTRRTREGPRRPAGRSVVNAPPPSFQGTVIV